MSDKNSVLKKALESNFNFLNSAENLLNKYYKENSSFDKSIFVCLKGFIDNSRNYIYSVYEDIAGNNNSQNIIYAKSNSNRALIRNCLEATILLYIFFQHPEYCDKYLETFESDLKRINNLYANIKTDDKYLKRFAWLPRRKGKRINNLNDLLAYVEFEDDNQKLFYQILIRNFDTFIHPSFNFSQNIENKNILDDTLIHTLYAKEGIMYQLHECFFTFYADYFKDIIPQEEMESLKNLISTSSETNNLEIHFFKRLKQYPNEIHTMSYVVALLPNFILPYNDFVWKRKNVGYLLQDLCIHYDDLLKSYFNNNHTLFFTEARHVFESLSLLNILLQENEKRNYIFHIHQDIKGFESKNTTYTMLGSEEYLEKKEQLEIEYEEHIKEIEKYYLEDFNQTVERAKILRLNGWSLFLKNQKNDFVPNAPDFIRFLIKDHFDKEEIENFVLGLFEESNAFMHITPYALYVTSDNKSSYTIKIINSILSTIIFGIIKIFRLDEILDEKVLNTIKKGFFGASQDLYKYINHPNKNS
ncbi:MAG: hypothetical protein IJV94_04815 [Bacilli bacterium]|nr:hypothetical protein [Bacilli bacterium]